MQIAVNRAFTALAILQEIAVIYSLLFAGAAIKILEDFIGEDRPIPLLASFVKHYGIWFLLLPGIWILLVLIVQKKTIFLISEDRFLLATGIALVLAIFFVGTSIWTGIIFGFTGNL